MRGGNTGMSNSWSSQSFCNRWLREQADLPRKHRSTLIYCTLLPSELQSVLVQIRQFEDRMNSGKGRIAVTRKLDRSVGTIELFVEGSKEMS